MSVVEVSSVCNGRAKKLKNVFVMLQIQDKHSKRKKMFAKKLMTKNFNYEGRAKAFLRLL
jgi:hypothetical protein